MKAIMTAVCLLSLVSDISIRAEFTKDPTATPPNAIALLTATKGNNAQGVVSFRNTPNGVLIIADVDNLVPGKHGFHIHEYSDCSAPDGTSTGGNYNPMGCRHGGPDSAIRHVGDLGNIVADENGYAHYERFDHLIKLEGPHSIIGRSIVIHTHADDYVSQPAGNSGGRIACGAIE